MYIYMFCISYVISYIMYVHMLCCVYIYMCILYIRPLVPLALDAEEKTLESIYEQWQPVSFELKPWKAGCQDGAAATKREYMYE